MHDGAFFSGFVLVLHACLARRFPNLYRYYMHVGADISRICNGITCMSGPIFFGFVSVLHAGLCRYIRLCAGITCMSGPKILGLYRYYMHFV